MKQLLCLFIFFLVQLTLNAQSFDTLQYVPVNKRLDQALKISLRILVSLDSSAAFKEYDKLRAFAIREKDKELEVQSLQHKAGYYYTRLANDIESGFAINRQAIELAQQYKLEGRAAKAMNQLGYYMFLNKDYAKGFENILMSDRIMKKVGYENIEKVYLNLYAIAFVYLELNNYAKAIEYYKKTIKYAEPDSELIMQFNNNLSNIYLRQEMYDEALESYQESYVIAKALKDTNNMAFIAGNIGGVFLELGQLDTARVLIRENLKRALREKDWRNASSNLIRLMRINRLEGKLDSAMSDYFNVKKFITLANIEDKTNLSRYFNTKIIPSFYQESASLFFELNEHTKAYMYLDSFVMVRDSIIKENDANMMLNLETQLMTEAYLNDINLLEKDKKYQNSLRNVIIVFLIIVISITLRSFSHLKQRKKKEKELLLLDKKIAEQELEDAKKDLESFMNGLKEKNRLLEQFKQEIDFLRANTSPELIKGREKTIEKLNKASIITDQGWKKFRRMFEDVHKGFFQRLGIKYPELTIAEVRLLALIKLDLTNDEIASMLGISTASVRKTSLRIRNKLDIKAHSDLFEFVESI